MKVRGITLCQSSESTIYRRRLSMWMFYAFSLCFYPELFYTRVLILPVVHSIATRSYFIVVGLAE